MGDAQMAPTLNYHMCARARACIANRIRGQ